MQTFSFEEFRQKVQTDGWIARSPLARFALASATVTVLLWVLNWQWRALQQSSVWKTTYSGMILVTLSCLVLLGYRWMTRRFMWRLRNRLVVTYIFIGVIPLVLLATIFLLAVYLFAGQFSTFVVTNDLQHELRRIESSNAVLANSLAEAVRSNPAALERSRDTRIPLFADRQVIANYKGKTYLVENGAGTPASETPPQLKQGSAIVLDKDARLSLRAIAKVPIKGENDLLTVVSSLPLDPKRMKQIASEMGIINVYVKVKEGQKIQQPSRGLVVGDSDLYSTAALQAGSLAPAQNLFDVEFIPSPVSLSVVQWDNAQPGSVVLTVRTRPSMLYGRLFRTLGEMTDVVSILLVVVCVIFAFIELAALIVGIRLARTITRSVAALYDATQHVNEGDLKHRIAVANHDQLATLETSFNSMTENLCHLIEEQKEKQRIESELNIAQEVQSLLFPRDVSTGNGLEIHGVCKPARTVSGDYYDFLPISPKTLGLAVGDISGKGISAALMMATVHAFVRAYTMVDPVPSLASAVAASAQNATTTQALRDGSITAGSLLSLLNQQLYQSTPAEKYVTMFLGFYDLETRRLHYSNGGHLPPVLISQNGHVHQLTTGGTVVGLFGNVSYPDGEVRMMPGDILLAYSDGVTEPENEFGEFGLQRLTELVLENRDLPLARISDLVLAAVADWIGGAEQPDDCTVVLARAV